MGGPPVLYPEIFFFQLREHEKKGNFIFSEGVFRWSLEVILAQF